MSETVGDLAARLRAAGRDGLAALLRRELVKTGLQAEGAARENIGARLKVRTGALRRSIASRVKEESGEHMLLLQAGAVGAAPYARMQEDGGEVRPTRGRFLAFPARGGPAETAGGVARYPSPRSVPGLRFVATRGGAGGLLVKDIGGRGKGGRGARTEVWYILARRVRIRGQHYLRDGIVTGRDVLVERLGSAVTELLEAAP